MSGKLRRQDFGDETSERCGTEEAARGVQVYEQTQQREDQQEQTECP